VRKLKGAKLGKHLDWAKHLMKVLKNIQKYLECKVTDFIEMAAV
jgi:hypothetical protein